MTVADVGKATDGSSIQTNIVRIDGQKSVYLPVLKQGGGANTIAVVNGIREAVSKLVDVPKTLVPNVVFDQSVFVKTAIENLLHEGAIGLCLTGLMIMVFLGNVRATVAVFLSIPLSALATFLCLSFGDNSINSMILGGWRWRSRGSSTTRSSCWKISSAIWRNRRIAGGRGGEGRRGGRAAGAGGDVCDGGRVLPGDVPVRGQPVPFLGAGALGGVLAVRFLHRRHDGGAAVLREAHQGPRRRARHYDAAGEDGTPVYDDLPSNRATSQGHGHAPARPVGWAARFNAWFNEKFNGFLDWFDGIQTRTLARPLLTVLAILALFLVSFALMPFIGLAYFPRTDPGQFVVTVKAPTGMRVEMTEQEVAKVENIIRRIVSKDDMGLIVSNIGVTPDFSAIYTSNSASHTAFVQTSLKEGHKVGSYEYMDRVRSAMKKELPELTTYFQSGGLVDAVLNLGLPAPIDIQVSATNLADGAAVAAKIARRAAALGDVSDVLVPQDVDAPALKLDVDRLRVGQLGLNEKEVVDNIITALTSNGVIAPSYWIDPKTGNDYLLTVQYPESTIKTLTDLKDIPLRAMNGKQTALLDAVAKVNRVTTPTEVDHYQLRRVIDVFVAPKGEALGGVANEMDRIIADVHPPEGVRVTMRGTVQAMRASFRSFGLGLILAIVLVYLILVAQFRSFVDPFLILLAVPPGITGVLLILAFSGTTLNIMSLMGVVMMVGIVTSNSILIVEFTHRLIEDGMPVREAVSHAVRVRLRPVLMTSLATLIGLIPMALKLGEGSESYAPLARSIIGGLAVSVVLTVFIVPSAFLLVHGRRERLAAEPTPPPAPVPEPAGHA